MWTCACVRAAHTPRSPATPGKCSAPNPNHRPPPSAPPQLGNLCFLTATPFLLISLRVILEASSRFKFTSSVSSARRPPFLSSLSHHLPSPRLLLVCLFLLPRSGSGVVQLPPTESRERKQRTGERNLGKVTDPLANARFPRGGEASFCYRQVLPRSAIPLLPPNRFLSPHITPSSCDRKTPQTLLGSAASPRRYGFSLPHILALLLS